MVNVAFFIRHFTERGTEVAVYNYAHYNEKILGNKSIIICFTATMQVKNFGVHFADRQSFKMFNERFQVIEINSFLEMPMIIQNNHLDFFYTLTHGGNDIYNFNDKSIWVPPCKTIKHCVFSTNNKEGDFYISIGNHINKENKCKVIPHIVDFPEINMESQNLREELNIPNNAFVFGRHGGKDTFNINFVKNAIINVLNLCPEFYFVFLNTPEFYKHPRIKYVEMNMDLSHKVRFINTCDAMIHARGDGETFGLAVAEFSFMNKPVFTCNVCVEREHINILGEKAVLYNDYDDLMNKFLNVHQIIKSQKNWNAYENYSPEIVMNLFNEHILRH